MAQDTASRPVALVTGAARRIGRAIALELAAHGWDVAVHCRSSLAEAEDVVRDCQRAGVRAGAFVADLADEAACNALVPHVLQRFGRLHAVVNNASVFEYDSVASFSYEQMEHHWRANTAPAIVLARALHRACAAASDAERGVVVNLLDQKLHNPNPDYLSYTLSKAALESATTLLAMALAPQVRVCAVAPGLTLPSGPMSERETEAAVRLTPLGRSSSTEDIARSVRFLLESPAITGSTLLVDGGAHLQPQARDVMFVVRGAQERAAG
jgi:NAD(P)-dependent dehydrogenase (short-subunit alcohol dehydrogenase family)